MNAQPSNRPSVSSTSEQQAAVRVRRQTRRQVHRSVALEISARLGVNLLLAAAAISALVRLVPYNLAQQDRLAELEAEVADVEQRVNTLRSEFDRHFDPQQAVSVMQEQSVRVDPNQRQIIWVAPSSTVAQEGEAADEQQASTKGTQAE